MENEVDTINLPRTPDLVFWLVSLVPVIFLLLWDMGKAWQRWAPWIPGQVLVLRPFIIHLLSFIDYSHISVYSGSRYQTVKVEAILVKNQLVIDSGRVMMCVLIAYLIPGMDGNNLAALAFSITFHAVSEFRSDWKVEKRNSHLNHYIVAIILIFAITYLLLLLIYAFVSGRTIRRFISTEVPSAISCRCTPNGRPRCNNIKDHVLKCWIVARLCQPDYVLSRSSLCSKLWPTVTSCFGCYIINWIYIYIYNESVKSVTEGTLVELVIAGQIVLVGIGWIVLLVRWVTSDGQGSFYGMILQDLKCELKVCFIRLFVRDSRIQQSRIGEILWYPRNNTTLSADVSDADVSDAVVSDADVSEEVVLDVLFSKYEETLKTLLFPGESAPNLWKANRRGLSRVKRYMDQGHEAGKRSPDQLICLLRLETGTPEDEAEAEHLRQANKNSWKRTAVSLIHLMIYFYDGSYDDSHASVIKDAMQCYIEAWEYMNFVDGLNEAVKSLGRQADGEFDSLQHSWNERALQPLRDQLKSLSNGEQCNLQNSWDSTKVAKYCLFETRTAMEKMAPEINKIHRLLARVYYSYMTQDLNKAVLQKCSELAKEGREEKIFDVAFLLAKAQGVLDKVGERHNTDQGSTSSPNQTENEVVGEGNGQAQATAKLIRDRFAHAVNTILTKLKLQWLSKKRSKELPQTQIEVKVIGNGDKDNATDNV